MTFDFMDKVATINAFLDLPPEALPQAYYLRGEDDDLCSAWDLLREYVADPDGCMRWEADIHLTADRDEWRDGITVTI